VLDVLVAEPGLYDAPLDLRRRQFLVLLGGPVIAIVRFCSAPIQFGNVLCSILSDSSLPATEYVPNVEMLPCTTALFSSAVPVVRLLDANL
jgi:hypothetical protein